MQCGSSEDLVRLHREAPKVINEKYRFSKHKLHVSRHLILAQRMNGKLPEIRRGVLIRLFIISYSTLPCQPTRSLWLGQNYCCVPNSVREGKPSRQQNLEPAWTWSRCRDVGRTAQRGIKDIKCPSHWCDTKDSARSQGGNCNAVLASKKIAQVGGLSSHLCASKARNSCCWNGERTVLQLLVYLV